MCEQSDSPRLRQLLDSDKFQYSDVTADGSERAWVDFERLETLWFNTGTLCNIECRRCYIDSSPVNDRLSNLTAREVARFLDEIADLQLGTREIGFTGGEPFVNPDFPAMLEDTLDRGFEALVLTNAMRPMMRPAVQKSLQRLSRRHGRRLHLRVSLDHYTPELHEQERGPGSWSSTVRGIRWLADEGFRLSVAGRTCWGETEPVAREGYAGLFATENLPLNATDPSQLVLFPEMDAALDAPEITVDCWRVLGVRPSDMMCARSRMVVRRRGATSPAVVSCTLLPYDSRFELGGSLAEALGPVRLNHSHCARFCVLGGGSCSVSSQDRTEPEDLNSWR
ncbi:MAG: radical SAM protein [bacterium]|nr:radical SAM protein [bacterium]